jgi:mRNA-degrading endonuclease toxin of MazEF toxin-antitoxin module
VGRFQFGQIIEAYIDDGLGQTKARPAVIISNDVENDAGEPLLLIAITRNIEDPCPAHHVFVHRGTKRDRRTGLRDPCVAKCNWVRQVPQSRVIRSLGYLPDDVLEAIVAQFDRIQSDENFTDWS